MIVVDIYLPALGREYDFRLNETILIDILIDEITDVICQKEQCSMSDEIGKLTLWDIRQERRLSGRETLAECGIYSGSKLLLV